MYSFSIVRIDQLCILALIISKNANCWLEVSTCTLAGSSLYAYGSSRNPANEYGRSNAVCREDYYTQVGKLVNSPHHKQCLSLMMKSMEHYWLHAVYYRQPSSWNCLQLQTRHSCPGWRQPSYQSDSAGRDRSDGSGVRSATVQIHTK